jgi:hypothetical protein
MAKHIGDFMKEGWTTTVPFYAFKCKNHGIVVNYKQGLKKELRCPECEKERKEDG